MADIGTPCRAIRQMCVECMGGQSHEVRKCVDRGCALWPFRMGTKPKVGSEEAKAQAGWEKRL